MNRLAILLALVPAVVAADRKEYNAGSRITHDCAKDAEVEVNTAGAEVTLVGTCDVIVLNGAGIIARIENGKHIEINGASDKVDIVGVDRLIVNGMDHVVTYKKPVTAKKPRVEVSGLNNRVTPSK